MLLPSQNRVVQPNPLNVGPCTTLADVSVWPKPLPAQPTPMHCQKRPPVSTATSRLHGARCRSRSEIPTRPGCWRGWKRCSRASLSRLTPRLCPPKAGATSTGCRCSLRVLPKASSGRTRRAGLVQGQIGAHRAGERAPCSAHPGNDLGMGAQRHAY